MSGALSFLLFAALFFFMMRFGCGAHAGHGGHGADHGGSGEGGAMRGALSASIDPVCGMRVDADTGYAKMYRGNSYRFCSRDCLDKFETDPDRYAGKSPAPASPMSARTEHRP